MIAVYATSKAGSVYTQFTLSYIVINFIERMIFIYTAYIASMCVHAAYIKLHYISFIDSIYCIYS